MGLVLSLAPYKISKLFIFVEEGLCGDSASAAKSKLLQFAATLLQLGGRGGG